MLVPEGNMTVTEFIIIGCSDWSKWRMPIVALLVINFSMALVGNGLIVTVVVSDARLHSPTYFFLCNLSTIDLGIIISVVPQTIAHCLVDRPVISLPLCFILMFSCLILGTTECLLLTVMAYDRYVAISSPLHYMLIMNRTVCITLVTVVWISALIILIVPAIALPFKFCGNKVVDHFVCEFKAVFKLLCGDISLHQQIIYGASVSLLCFPLSFILFSYLRILMSILRMTSEGSRMKAFSTCGSHLAMVAMFFGSPCSVISFLSQKKHTSLIKLSLPFMQC